MERTERDERILRFLARYKLATVDILARVFFEGLSPKSAERVIGRLRKHKLVIGYPLVDRQYYYTLTRKGARVLGLDEKRVGASMGLQAITQHYSILLYCHATTSGVTRLTHDEFATHFPDLARSHPAALSRYVLSPVPGTDRVRLTLLVTDMGSHPRRLVRKCRRQFHSREEASRAWQQCTSAGLFEVLLLTGFERKARKLRVLLEDDSYPTRVCVLPQLAPLVTCMGQARPAD